MSTSFLFTYLGYTHVPCTPLPPGPTSGRLDCDWDANAKIFVHRRGFDQQQEVVGRHGAGERTAAAGKPHTPPSPLGLPTAFALDATQYLLFVPSMASRGSAAVLPCKRELSSYVTNVTGAVT